ncbi:hypothetical protein JOQ06_010978 [Pogonophryne albipinna]|uniref:HAT C-terminal dimerisation domain-containing protein n=1 Tax=Pogonophryne albipinna TaxID=1090488 RepID=A0AAD6FG44_9TELE|nr:hypothetical protein JOQ06_010978 [Pogonophryne albipinna]
MDFEKIITFIRKLCSKFLLPTVLQTHFKPQDIPYVDKENHLPGYKLNVGFITRMRLNHLLDAGDITAQKVELFHTASLNFFVKAVEYALQRLPLSEPLLKHARFLDVRQRAEYGVEDALYFVDRYAHLLPYHSPQDHDSLGEEFLDYQTMPVPILEADPDIEGFWANMASLKHKVTGVGRFDRLSTVAKLVLVLPHSNADAERVFSVVGLNKTKTRNSLSLEGTLSSLMTIKMADLEPCFKWEPTQSMLETAKSATSSYNRPDHSQSTI